MDTEDFVTYEQALSLKELGFDEFVLYKYEANTLITPNELIYRDYNDDYMYFNSCSAPTLAQAQKWLFEKGYFVEVNWFCSNKTNYWWFNIVNLDLQNYYQDSKDYDSPSIALSEGITKCLKLIENENTK